MSSQCLDTGIQESLLVHKQTNHRRYYTKNNVFNEITESQCQALG
ncbi:MAG: hypothetical protein ACR5LA_05490 [Wolbachia sp.]